MIRPRYAPFPNSNSQRLILPTRFWSFAIFVFGLALHWLGVQNLWAFCGVLLTLVAVAFPLAAATRIIPSEDAKNASNLFWLFVAIYLAASGFARANAAYFNEFNEIYQNDSDAWTIYLLSSERFGQHMGDLARVTDTGGAINIFSFFYRSMESLGIPLSPGIGIAVNVALVSFGATIGIAGTAKMFPGDEAIRRAAIVLFATSGMAFVFAGLHLRDAYLFALASLLYYVLVSIRIKDFISSVLPSTVSAAAIVGAMVYFRGESSYIFVGFVAAIAVDLVLRTEGLIKYILLMAMALAGLFVLTVLSSSYSDQIEATRAVYENELGQSGGLAADYVFNQNVVFRFIFGSIYLTLLNVPFFAGFLKEETFFWFIAIQSTQALIVLPCTGYALFRLARPHGDPRLLLLRRVAVFYLLMLAVISQTTLGYRHIGQFLPCLYALTAYGFCQSSRTYKAFGVLALAVILPAAWIVLKL